MSVLNLPKTLRAAAVAVTVAGTSFAAAPVQSQDVDFNFRFGTPGFSFRFGDHDRFRYCMSNREVRRDLRRDGYRDIRFFDRRGRIVQVVADLGRRTYEIAYDSCRGRIVDRDRIRRRG